MPTDKPATPQHPNPPASDAAPQGAATIGRQINDHYEALARRFRRDTGLTAPGKDRAAAEGEQRLEGQALITRWRDWLAEQNEGPPDWRGE